MKNLFLLAIEENELVKFAGGEAKYYISVQDWPDHSAHQSWLRHIIPLLDDELVNFVNSNIIRMVDDIINSKDLSLERKAWLVLQHIHIFYYFKLNGKFSIDIFEDFKKINELLNSFMALQYAIDLESYLKYKDTIHSIQIKNGLKNFDISINLAG